MPHIEIRIKQCFQKLAIQLHLFKILLFGKASCILNQIGVIQSQLAIKSSLEKRSKTIKRKKMATSLQKHVLEEFAAEKMHDKFAMQS